MVLAELGNSIASAIQQISRQSKIDDKNFTIFQNEIAKALMASDVNVKLIKEMNERIKAKVRHKDLPVGIDVQRVIEKAVIEEMTNLLNANVKAYQPRRGKPNVIMFIGLQGSGKTTTCTKLAHYYKTKGWKVALVCADTYRAGAFDQLRQNATRAKIPYFGDRNETDPAVLARKGVDVFKKKKFEIIIVDTSGRHMQQESLFEEMEAIDHAVKPDQSIFVLDSTIGQAAEAQAAAFKERVKVASVIITKLDGNAKGGGALSAVAVTGAPIIFIGVGEHINELEKFDTSRFVKRILGKGDLATLVEKVKEHNLDDSKKLINEIKKGKFSLRMMKDQFQNILKMGSFSQLMSMIPGLNNMPKESEQASQKRLQTFLVMMDSMTDEELDSNDISIFEKSASRRRRVAQGSGVRLSSVDDLLNVYRPFAACVAKMKKMPFGKNGELPKNPQQLAGLSNMIPQNVLKQMGGQSGFMNLMQKFQSAEGAAGLQNMQKMMGSMKSLNKAQRRRRR